MYSKYKFQVTCDRKMAVYPETASLCFKVDNYDRDLARRLHARMRAMNQCDVTMLVGDVTLHAHRAVLSACSSYFDSMFSERWSKSDTYDLSHIFSSSQTLQSIIDYMYTGQITITKDTLVEILNSASLFLLTDLKDLCAKYIVANLAVKNCLPLWLLCEQYDVNAAEPVCQALVKSHFHHYLVYEDESLSIPETCLQKLIHEGVLDLLTTDQRMSFLTQWSQQNQCTPPTYSKLLQSFECREVNTNSIEKEVPDVIGECEPFQAITNNTGKPRLKRAEALFGYVKSKTTNDITIYLHLEDTNKWLKLGEYPESSWSFLEKGRLVGFSGTNAVYARGTNCQNTLADLNGRTSRTIDYPVGHPEDILNRRLFCFDGQLLHLCEKHTPSTGQAERSVLLLDEDSMTWHKCLDIDPEHAHIPAVANLSYTTVEQDDLVYIWGQDHSTRSKGVYWMCLHRTADSKYTLKMLAAPPIRSGDLRVVTPLSMRGWKHARMNISGGQGIVSVYRERKILGDSQQFDVLLTYEVESDSWTRQEKATVLLPKSLSLPLEANHHTHQQKGIVQVDQTCDVQSFSCGNVYHVQREAPFVSKLWANNMADGSWKQITPPPIDYPEMFFRYDVCQVPVEVASACGSCVRYVDHTESLGHSPLVHWDLHVNSCNGKLLLQRSNEEAIKGCNYC